MPRDAGRRSLAARLRRARREGFVGRTDELAHLRHALDGSAAPVMLLHGLGGIGKTALLDRFAHEAEEAGRHVVRLDAVALDPTIEAGEAGEAGEAVVHGDHPAPVLLIDALDDAPAVEPWLRTDLLPRLPDDAVVVLAGRDRPAPEWQTDPGWRELVETVHLPPLDEEVATRLLLDRDAPGRGLATLLRFAGGNPLALCLAADDAGPDDRWLPGRGVVRTLLDRMLTTAPDADHDLALRVCAHAQHTTVDLLRAFLDDGAATTAFAWLSAQSFVETGAHGLRIDDLVRRLVDSDHRWRDPQGYDDVHRTVWQHLGRRAFDAHGDATTPAVADLVHLHRYRHPERHESGALGALEQLVEVDVGADLPTTVLELAGRHLGPEGRKDVEYWLARRPEAFTVYARHTGEPSDPREPPCAFLTLLRLGAPDDDVVAADPVVGTIRAHAAAGGDLRPDEELEVARFVVPRPRTGHLAAGDPRLVRWYDALFRRAGRLTASYVVLHDPDPCVPFMLGLDHALEGRHAASDDLTWGVFAHDWRAVPLPVHLERVLPAVGVVVDETPVTPTLCRDDFDEAVRQALRDWHDDDALAANPLADEGVDTLRSSLEAAISLLADDPRRAKQHRAVATTYLKGVTTQEAAAHRLGVPFSTYRRHLGKGTALVADRMWSARQGG
jgi:hypothetical protein